MKEKEEEQFDTLQEYLVSRGFKKYKVPLYPGALYIGVDIRKELSDVVYEWSGDGSYDAFVAPIGDIDTVMMIEKSSVEEGIVDAGLIAHESLHVVSRIMDVAGIKMDTDNDEPLAYLIQWVVNNAHAYMQDYELNEMDKPTQDQHS